MQFEVLFSVRSAASYIPQIANGSYKSIIMQTD